jgi:hypothetical protein
MLASGFTYGSLGLWQIARLAFKFAGVLALASFFLLAVWILRFKRATSLRGGIFSSLLWLIAQLNKFTLIQVRSTLRLPAVMVPHDTRVFPAKTALIRKAEGLKVVSLTGDHY